MSMSSRINGARVGRVRITRVMVPLEALKASNSPSQGESHERRLCGHLFDCPRVFRSSR
jgi:hypothetical protein